MIAQLQTQQLQQMETIQLQLQQIETIQLQLLHLHEKFKYFAISTVGIFLAWLTYSNFYKQEDSKVRVNIIDMDLNLKEVRSILTKSKNINIVIDKLYKLLSIIIDEYESLKNACNDERDYIRYQGCLEISGDYRKKIFYEIAHITKESSNFDYLRLKEQTATELVSEFSKQGDNDLIKYACNTLQATSLDAANDIC